MLSLLKDTENELVHFLGSFLVIFSKAIKNPPLWLDFIRPVICEETLSKNTEKNNQSLEKIGQKTILFAHQWCRIAFVHKRL